MSTSPTKLDAPDIDRDPPVTDPVMEASPPTFKASVTSKSSFMSMSFTCSFSHGELELPNSLVPLGIIFESTTPFIVTVSLASLPKSALPVTLSNVETVVVVNVPAGADTTCPLD